MNYATKSMIIFYGMHSNPMDKLTIERFCYDTIKVLSYLITRSLLYSYSQLMPRMMASVVSTSLFYMKER